MIPARTAACTAAALAAFAANSILCRLALGPGHLDPLTFTAVRVGSAALVLGLLSRGGGRRRWRGSPLSALLLAAYAVPFSLAYVSLGAATGALILFGAVQITMIAAGIAAGERPGPGRWAGGAVAAAGLLALLAPGASRPDPLGAALMAVAGAAWGGYSLRGRTADDPVATTADNFLLAAPLAIAPVLAAAPPAASSSGVAWALGSGVLASGLGYAVWYAAVPRLSAVTAAIVQLAVPVLTAAAAVLVLGETVGPRLVVAGSVTLAGVALAAASRSRRPSPATIPRELA